MTSSPRALHSLLETLVHSPLPAPRAWERALGALVGTPEFAAKHTELCGALSEVLTMLSSMPPKRKERFDRYVHDWWELLILPSEDWASSNRTADSLLGTMQALDQLASLADLIEVSMRGTPYAPAGSLDDLRAVCEEWEDALTGMPELSEEFRSQLRLQLAHVIWLIDNAHLFGYARATHAANALLGSVVQADAAGRSTSFKRFLHKYTASVVLGTTAFAATGVAVTQVAEVADIVERTIDAVLPDRDQPTPELESGGGTDRE